MDEKDYTAFRLLTTSYGPSGENSINDMYEHGIDATKFLNEISEFNEAISIETLDVVPLP